MFGEDQLDMLEGSIEGFRFEGSNLSDFFSGQYGIVTLIFFFAGVAVLLYAVYAGLQFMTARGDPKGLEAAKNRLTHALVGLIILFTAYWIVQIVGRILGLEGITQTFI